MIKQEDCYLWILKNQADSYKRRKYHFFINIDVEKYISKTVQQYYTSSMSQEFGYLFRFYKHRLTLLLLILNCTFLTKRKKKKQSNDSSVSTSVDSIIKLIPSSKIIIYRLIIRESVTISMLTVWFCMIVTNVELASKFVLYEWILSIPLSINCYCDDYFLLHTVR